MDTSARTKAQRELEILLEPYLTKWRGGAYLSLRRSARERLEHDPRTGRELLALSDIFDALWDAAG